MERGAVGGGGEGGNKQYIERVHRERGRYMEGVREGLRGRGGVRV
jgi:hypothetical protein